MSETQPGFYLERLPLPVRTNVLWSSGRGRGQFYLSKTARVKRDKFVAEVQRRLGGRPEPLTGPLMVDIQFACRDRREADADAYLKATLDWLDNKPKHAGLYEDDKQIVRLTVSRHQPDPPGWITIEILPLLA